MYIEPTTSFSYNHSVNTVMHPQQDIFEFYSGEPNNKIGTLVCHKSNMNFRPDYKGPVLAIDFLETTVHDRGDGSKIIKFAENYSKETGCNGYMVLKTDSTFTPERTPHTFYRKMGFTTRNRKIDRKLDRLLRKNKSAKFGDFHSMLMVYPALPQKEGGFFKKIINGVLKLVRGK